MRLKYVKIVVQGLLTSFSSFQHAMELHSDYSVVTSHAMKFSKNNKYIYPSILFLSSILLGAFTWTLFFVSLTELFHLKGDSRVAPFLCGVRNNEQGLRYLPISGYTYTNILHLNGAKKKKERNQLSPFPAIYPPQTNIEPPVILIQILTYSTLG